MEDWNLMINGHEMGNHEFEVVLDEFKPTDQFYQNPSQTFNNSNATFIDITQNSWNFNINVPSTGTQTISPNISSSSSSSQFISFGEHQQPFCENLDSFVEPRNEVMLFNEEADRMISPTYLKESYDGERSNLYAQQPDGNGTMPSRTESNALDHVMAERKRRERLTERIIALSAIIPGLKRIDKLSVLGEAIKYLKHLQERVKQLEKHVDKKSEESVVLVNKSNLSPDPGSSLCGENSGKCIKESRSEIEARVSENNVLIRVHCEKKKGFLTKVISEIEKLNLIMVNSSVLPFGNYAMDITIVARISDEYNLTVQDLVRNLQSTLL